MGTIMKPVEESDVLPKRASIGLQTHPKELPSRDFKTLLKMISDYEGQMLPLKIEPEMACVSVQKDFTEVYDNYQYLADAACQTDRLKELEVRHSAHISIQADMDEEASSQEAKTDPKDTKPTTTSVQVQTMQPARIHTTTIPNGVPQLHQSSASNSNLAHELETFKREIEHLYNIMKCEQHILDLRFSILEHRHEIVDDRVFGILKCIPEAMAHINPRPRKRITMFAAMRHFLREALFGSLIVALLSLSTLYTALVNMIKYNFVN